MKLHELNTDVQTHKKPNRVGRGIGSGHGKTSARGYKGAQSRSGYRRLATFQGGMMPVVRRVPKRGFNNRFAESVASLNVVDLESYFNAGEEVTPATLKERGLIRYGFDKLKILGNGELTKALKISAHLVSASAKEKIEKSGSTLTILPGKAPVVRNKQRSAKKK